MSFAKKRILIVDDSASTVMYMQIVLKRMGFDVRTAPNGLEGLRRVQEDAPDLLILDLSMPVMDGRTMLKKLKETKGSANLPVVILSVEESEETRTEMGELGSLAYLRKPVELDQLYGAIEEAIFLPLGTGRRCLRSVYREPVVLRSGGVSQHLLAENLSERGIFVCTKDPLAVGDSAKVTFGLGREGLLSLTGRVIYRKTSQEGLFTSPPGMAIEFDRMPSYAATILNEFIQQLLGGGLMDAEDEAEKELDTDGPLPAEPAPMSSESS